MDLIEKSQFPDYFNGLSYDDVVGRLSRHLPNSLEYEAEAIASPDLTNTYLNLRGIARGLVVFSYAQYFNLVAGTTSPGDMKVDKDWQGGKIGSYLSYNNLLFRRDLGLKRTRSSSECMGGYVWSRIGSLVDVDLDEQDIRQMKWHRNADFINGELAYICKRLDLPQLTINSSQPDCLWNLVDYPVSGFLGSDGFFATVAPENFDWNEIMEVRFSSRAALMHAIHATDLQYVTLGQLVLFNRNVPTVIYLQEEESPLAARQWERIRNYMRAKGYPDLQPK